MLCILVIYDKNNRTQSKTFRLDGNTERHSKVSFVTPTMCRHHFGNLSSKINMSIIECFWTSQSSLFNVVVVESLTLNAELLSRLVQVILSP